MSAKGIAGYIGAQSHKAFISSGCMYLSLHFSGLYVPQPEYVGSADACQARGGVSAGC